MRYLLVAAALAAAFITHTASAQVPPAETEVVRYNGLHAAAHKGQAEQIQKLVANGAGVNAAMRMAARRFTSRRSPGSGKRSVRLHDRAPILGRLKMIATTR